MGANIPFRVEFDGESIGSIFRARKDLQQRRIARSMSKNVLKRKSATLKKYGGKLKNGGPKNFCRMCGVIISWTAGEDPGRFACLLRPLGRWPRRNRIIRFANCDLSRPLKPRMSWNMPHDFNEFDVAFFVVNGVPRVRGSPGGKITSVGDLQVLYS